MTINEEYLAFAHLLPRPSPWRDELIRLVTAAVVAEQAFADAVAAAGLAKSADYGDLDESEGRVLSNASNNHALRQEYMSGSACTHGVHPLVAHVCKACRNDRRLTENERRKLLRGCKTP